MEVDKNEKFLTIYTMQCKTKHNARRAAALLIPQGFTLKLLPNNRSSPLQESVSHPFNKLSAGIAPCYRQRLRDNWGIVDVDDCANAAQYLAKQGKVDGKRLTIDGGSAGGQQIKAYYSLLSACLLQLQLQGIHGVYYCFGVVPLSLQSWI